MKINIEQLLPNRDFPDYTPFSQLTNSLYFQYALPFLNHYIQSKEAIFACRNHFEELVSKSTALEDEYVEHYNTENKFYVTQRVDKNKTLDIYIIAREKLIVMFFIREAP